MDQSKQYEKFFVPTTKIDGEVYFVEIIIKDGVFCHNYYIYEMVEEKPKSRRKEKTK
jgi:hypothetical protein